jgi:hypothetical protein
LCSAFALARATLAPRHPPLAAREELRHDREMNRRTYFLKLAFSVVIDVFDLTLGRIPIFGAVTEGVGTLVLFAMWGPAGLVNAWELVDFTDQADAFIPTATLVALYVGWREGMFGKGSPTAPPTARD